MAIFTPGLKVSDRTLLVKTRRLPLKGEVLVQKGQRVKAFDIIAKTELPGKIYPINIANQLGVPASRLKEAMLKDIGDRIVEGELIAQTKGFMGLFRSESHALVSGTIQSISPISGEVIIQANPIPVVMDAYVDGLVVDVLENEGCSIQTSACLVQGIFGLGGEVQAPLQMGVQSAGQTLDASQILDNMKGHIVVAGAFVTKEAVQKAIDVGAKAIITGGFDYNDIKDLLGYEVGVAITGSEEIGISIMVTEGFGEIAMAPKSFSLLKKYDGYQASLNGSTQIRAGVIRPEVIITHTEDDLPKERWNPPEPKGIQLGDRVRGIRSPYFGKLGFVHALPISLETMPSETKVRVLEIQFDDGTIATVPRANVESIEE
ncbi:MAG: hypothetical protein VX278_23880 [Myxococcota bacterium]|nr:hypothetical protein [Myxococcota bacterium]